jgi:hypothetical protein
MATTLSDSNVSGRQSKVLRRMLTAVRSALVRAALVLVVDVCTSVLISGCHVSTLYSINASNHSIIQVARVKVPAGRPR